MKRDTSPFRYARWFAFDLLRTQIVLYTIVAIGLSLLIWRFQVKSGSDISAVTVQQGTFVAGLTIVVLMAIGGSIGGDLSAGFYRAWFSKPMAPAWYYFQRWVLAGLAVLSAPLLLGAALQVVLRHGSGITAELMTTVALGYLLIASATLLISNFTAKDWLVVFLLSFLEGRLAALITLSKSGLLELPEWVVAVSKVLPPFHLISPSAPALHGYDLWHVIGYGVGMLVLALVIVQYRPLGSGGRA